MNYFLRYSIKLIFILFFILFSCDESGTPSSGSDDNPDGTLVITSLDIIYNFNQDVAGFQFQVTGVSLLSASGGIAEESGFTVSTGENSGIVIGFSLDGSVIVSGSGILTQLAVQSEPSTQTCIAGITLSDPDGNAIQIDDSVLRFNNNSNCTTIGGS